MNMLFVYKYCTTGGVETGIKNRIKHLDFSKHSIDLLFFHDFGGKSVFDKLACNIIIENDSEKISNIISENNYDYIFTIDTPEILSIIDYRKYFGKIVLEVHTTYEDGLRYLSKIKKNDVCFIIVPSQYQKDLVENLLDVEIPIKILPNALDSEVFEHIDLFVKNVRPILLWVGRIDEHKNWRLYFQICKEINKNLPGGFDFWLIGGLHSDSTEIKIFNDMILDYNLNVSFKWIPVLCYKNMAKAYSYVASSGGCYVLTSKNESFGMTILEAMACNCPVICNDVGAVKEIVTEDTGLTIDMSVLKVSEITDRILKYINSDSKNLRANNAKVLVDKNFKDMIICQQFISML